VIYQSASAGAHEAALEKLLDAGLAYPCGCSRKDLADAPQGPLGIIYPGNCRNGCDASETAIRLRTNDEPITFIDALQGEHTQRLESESGDFVVHRRDGLIAYQLAVVVDDELEGITEVVRGIDIIDSTPRQIWLQRLLGYRTPAYLHIPVVTHPDGDKLSKLTGAPGVPLEKSSRLQPGTLENQQGCTSGSRASQRELVLDFRSRIHGVPGLGRHTRGRAFIKTNNSLGYKPESHIYTQGFVRVFLARYLEQIEGGPVLGQ